MLSLMTYLMKWCSYTSLSTFPLSYSCSRTSGVRVDVAIRISLAILIALKSKDINVILIVVGNLITKPTLTVLPSPFVQAHLVGQRVRFMPKLSRPHRFALKSKTSLELSDIRDGCDILVLFLEVSPGCHLIVMSSLWVSWFSEPLLSPGNYAG